MLTFKCDGCGVQFKGTAKQIGRRFKCPKCGTEFRIPSPSVAGGGSSSAPGAVAPAGEVPLDERFLESNRGFGLSDLEDPADKVAIASKPTKASKGDGVPATKPARGAGPGKAAASKATVGQGGASADAPEAAGDKPGRGGLIGKLAAAGVGLAVALGVFLALSGGGGEVAAPAPVVPADAEARGAAPAPAPAPGGPAAAPGSPTPEPAVQAPPAGVPGLAKEERDALVRQCLENATQAYGPLHPNLEPPFVIPLATLHARLGNRQMVQTLLENMSDSIWEYGHLTAPAHVRGAWVAAEAQDPALAIKMLDRARTLMTDASDKPMILSFILEAQLKLGDLAGAKLTIDAWERADNPGKDRKDASHSRRSMLLAGMLNDVQGMDDAVASAPLRDSKHIVLPEQWISRLIGLGRREAVLMLLTHPRLAYNSQNSSRNGPIWSFRTLGRTIWRARSAPPTP